MTLIEQWYDYFIYVVTIILLIVISSIVYRSYRNGITPMPSNAMMHQVVVNEIKRLRVEGHIVDAGSGWGTLLYKLAKNIPNCTYTGVENSIIPYIYAKLRQKRLQTKYQRSVTFVKDNIYEYNYESTQLIVCYLYPDGMQKLIKAVMAQNIKHMYIVSICFAINDLKPVRTTICNDLYRTKVYTYEINHDRLI